jgi:hypothetical protein
MRYSVKPTNYISTSNGNHDHLYEKIKDVITSNSRDWGQPQPQQHQQQHQHQQPLSSKKASKIKELESSYDNGISKKRSISSKPVIRASHNIKGMKESV